MLLVEKQYRLVLRGLVLALFGLSALVLAGCNPGDTVDDSAETPSTPSPKAPVLTFVPTAIKTFSFSWGDVADETEYRLLENPDGESGYTQIATVAADVTGYDLAVLLPARINARYILQACNSGGCSDSSAVHVAGSLAESVGYVKASNADSQDRFGYSVTLSGDGSTLAVGSTAERSSGTGVDAAQDDNSIISAGAVYVFTRNGSAWSQQAYVKASNTEARQMFGYSVALSYDGGTLAVGAFQEGSNATGIDGAQDDDLPDEGESGAVYVFTRSGTLWSQQAYVKASNTGANDNFGIALALSNDGNTLAVGAIGESSNATGINGADNNLAVNSGAAYVFSREGGLWSQQAYIKASNTGASDRFGSSLDLSADGNTLAVGAWGEFSAYSVILPGGTCGGVSECTQAPGDNTWASAGATYVFTRDAGVWAQEAYIKAFNGAQDTKFGNALALSSDGDTLAVGSFWENSNVTGICVISDTGCSASDGNKLAMKSGAAYVFVRDAGIWSRQAYIKASNTSPGDEFGIALALSDNGNTLVVGTRYEGSNATGIGGDQNDNTATNSGAAYLYSRSNGIWSQQAYIKAPNADSEDYFGFSVALSGDGSILAVGAAREDGGTTGIGGEQDDTKEDSGAVYLY